MHGSCARGTLKGNSEDSGLGWFGMMSRMRWQQIHATLPCLLRTVAQLFSMNTDDRGGTSDLRPQARSRFQQGPTSHLAVVTHSRVPRACEAFTRHRPGVLSNVLLEYLPKAGLAYWMSKGAYLLLRRPVRGAAVHSQPGSGLTKKDPGPEGT